MTEEEHQSYYKAEGQLDLFEDPPKSNTLFYGLVLFIIAVGVALFYF